MNRTSLRVSVAAFAVLLAAGCASYPKIMQKKVKEVMGPQYEHFRYSSYPTNNFGLGTAYVGKARTGDEICDSVGCLGVDPASLDTFDKWLRLDGYANIGDNGGQITLTEKENRKLAFQAFVPKVAEVLELDASLLSEKTIDVKLTIPQAYPRVLNRLKFTSYIASEQAPQLLKDAYAANTLVMVVSDVIVREMSASVCVKSTTDAKVKAKLNESLGKVVGRDSAIHLAVGNAATGCYRLEVVRPVIVAIYAKQKPKAGPLAATAASADKWDDWEMTDIELQNSAFDVRL